MEIIVNSLYKTRDIFLRELISNANDAIDKIRMQSLTDKSLLGETTEFSIKLQADKDEGTLTILDTGIGMEFSAFFPKQPSTPLITSISFPRHRVSNEQHLPFADVQCG